MPSDKPIENPSHHLRDEPLSPVDAAWLHMDRPSNLMMITALFELDGRLERGELEEVLRELLLREPRFRQRVAQRRGRPFWTADADFALDAHVHRIGLPAPGGPAALAELVSDLASTPLDHGHPLWQIHVIDQGDGGSALVVRLHHAVADGVALVRLLLALTDHDGPAEAPRVGPRPQAPAGWRRRLRRLAEGAGTLVHDLRLAPDPDTALRGPLGVRKQVAWSVPTPLAPIQALARAHDGTVTDVLAAAITGALRRYLDAHGDLCHVHDVRALVPVNLRGAGTDGAVGNRFGLVYLPLPLGEPTPEARLAEVHRRMTLIKASPEASVGLGVLGALGVAGAMAERLGIQLFTSKASTMITSVPGPSAPVRLAGRPVRHMAVWAPASGSLALTFSLLSYAGSVSLGVAADRQVVTDAEVIVAEFEDELARLLRSGRVSAAASPRDHAAGG